MLTDTAPADTITITTTLGEVAMAADALARLSQIVLPGPCAYQVAKLSRLVATDLELFTDQRHALIRELGTQREATPAELEAGAPGAIVAVAPDRLAEFSARLAAMAAVVVVIPMPPIRLDLQTITIRPADLQALDPFLAAP